MSSPAPASIKFAPAKTEADSKIGFGDDFDDINTDSVGSGKENVGRVKKRAKIMLSTKKPGSWTSDPNSTRSSPGIATSNTTLAKPPSPIANAFPNATTLPDRTPDFQKCQHCKRAVSKQAMPKHVENCLNKKQEKQRKKKEAKDARDAAARKEKNAANGIADSEDEEGDGDGKTVSKTGGMGTSKKRKAGADAAEDGDAAGPAKKKSKKSGTANITEANVGANSKTGKAARPKAPVDVEKQCGVTLPQGGQCARSLTCKSHSMGAKRAVPGRSAPYDKLLMEYQRKNQAKLQKAVFEAAKPGEEDDDDGGEGGEVDWEAEREGVLAGVGRGWGGAPIWGRTGAELRSMYKYHRIRGMLSTAFSKGGLGGVGVFGPGSTSTAATLTATPASATAPLVDENGVVHARRGSVIPGARSMMAPAGSRKASINANGSGNNNSSANSNSGTPGPNGGSGTPTATASATAAVGA